MKDYLILKDLFDYLTYENITGRDRDCKMEALIKDNAIEFIAAPTLTLIENPLTKESFTIHSDNSDYEEKLNAAKENNWTIWHDSNNTIEKIIHDKVTPFTIEAMCHYKDIELPNYLDTQVGVIKEKLQALLVDFDTNKKESFVQYLKGELQNKINGESELLDKFPCIKDLIIQIQDYLINYWNIDLKLIFPTMEEEEQPLPVEVVDSNTPEIVQSIFDPKEIVKSTLINNIYEVLTENGILSKHKNEKLNLYKVLTEYVPDAKIHFNCETNLMVNTLELLSELFLNLTPKTIEESKIFYTRRGTKMKANYYYGYIKMNDKQKAEFEKIKTELEEFIPEAIKAYEDKISQ